MDKCQVQSIGPMSFDMKPAEVVWQRRNRVKRIFKRRMGYLFNLMAEKALPEKDVPGAVDSFSSVNLQKGDVVRVKSKEEIKRTLNRWNQLKGCAFMEEMYPYCGTTQRVLKRVEKFLDERDYLIKKCSGIVILNSVFCTGTNDFGKCDRTCFFFWREEWLEKVDVPKL